MPSPPSESLQTPAKQKKLKKSREERVEQFLSVDATKKEQHAVKEQEPPKLPTKAYKSNAFDTKTETTTTYSTAKVPPKKVKQHRHYKIVRNEIPRQEDLQNIPVKYESEKGTEVSMTDLELEELVRKELQKSIEPTSPNTQYSAQAIINSAYDDMQCFGRKSPKKISSPKKSPKVQRNMSNDSEKNSQVSFDDINNIISNVQSKLDVSNSDPEDMHTSLDSNTDKMQQQANALLGSIDEMFAPERTSSTENIEDNLLTNQVPVFPNISNTPTEEPPPDPQPLSHSINITLPSVISKLQEIDFPPMQLQHLNAIKTTTETFHKNVDNFNTSGLLKIEAVIPQYESIIKRTNELLEKNSLTKTISNSDGPAPTSARFRPSGGAPATSTGNLIAKKLAQDWETTAKKINEEVNSSREQLEFLVLTQENIRNELYELKDNFDDPDTVQATLSELKSSYRNLAREYRRMQFKFTNLRAGQYLALSNSIQEGKTNELEVILFQVKQLENENERMESVFKTLVEKNSKLKIEKVINNLPPETHTESEKRQIEFLKASLVALSEENEAMQIMYNNQQQMIESVSAKRAQPSGVSDDVKFLEEENQILQASVDEAEQENRRLRMQIESAGDKDTAELEKKIKKLKSENSKYKKEKKRLLNAAQMLSGVEMTDELEQLAKCRGVSTNLRKKIEEKYDTILRDLKKLNFLKLIFLIKMIILSCVNRMQY